MQEILENQEAESDTSSEAQHDENVQHPDDTDADAFAILSLLVILTFAIFYFLNP